MDEPRELEVTDNASAERFEAEVDGELAVLEYRRAGDTLVLTHTEVPSRLEGRGIGGALVRRVLDRVREEGQAVRAECGFVRAWLRRHPEYDDLVG